jgi:hypothetical protein
MKARDDASRPPHPIPTFVTTADAPLAGQDGRNKPVIWVGIKQNYFREGNWTAQIGMKSLGNFDFW